MNFILLLLISSFVFTQDCSWWQTYIEDVPENVDIEENDDNCFGTNDLEKLQEIINLNESLEGSLPLEIGDQSWENHRITYLNLYSSGLDTIPNTISEMTKLRYLYLSANPLRYIPETINELDRLERFYIHTCQIQQVPESIGELSHLRSLWIYNNQLTSLPESFGNLDELEILKISNNNLDSLPDSFGNLENLEELDIINNNLSTLPENFEYLTNLNYLNLFNNNLENFVDNPSDFESLEVLNLGNNSLDSISSEICNIYENLSYISFDNNNLCPPYPECLTEMDIGVQNLDACDLCGDGYTWIDDLPGNVQVPNDTDCFFEGDLSVLSEIIQFNNLQLTPPFFGFNQVWENGRIVSLNLSYSSLGGLPNEIQELHNLKQLDLSNNQMFFLNGAVTNIQNLEDLNLINNPLMELPNSIGDLINLENFSVNSSNLDSIPESFSDLDSLRFVFINSAGITTIPLGIETNQNMIELNLAGNQLESLPENLCDLPSVSVINVSNNNLCNEFNFDCITFWGEQNCLNNQEQIILSEFEIQKIYPNPFNSVVNIEVSIPKYLEPQIELEILDINGKPIYQFLTNNQFGPLFWAWNAEGYSSGTYFVRLKSGSVTKTQKLILIK